MSIYCRERVKQRLALYQGVMPIYMPFSDDAEETFSRALKLLQVSNSIKTIFLFRLSYTSVEVGKSVNFVFALSVV